MSNISIYIFCLSLVFTLSVEARTVRDVIKNIEKRQGPLPSYKAEKNRKKDRINLTIVAPPRFTTVFPEGTAEREYEQKLNKEIQQLIILSKRIRSDSTKQGIYMRLARAYSEKAALIERRLQEEYDKNLKLYLAGSRSAQPTLNLKSAKVYSSKANEIYKNYVRNYPSAKDLDEVLFFLGYNSMSQGKTEEAIKYYSVLAEKFPKSEYVGEANLSLGDYYFDKDRRATAKSHYEKVVSNGNSQLKLLGLYKLAWVQLKMGDKNAALSNMLKVIRYSGTETDVRSSRKLTLGNEAKRDLPMFYAEAGNPKNALTFFTNIMPREEAARALEKLAYYYVDKGDREEARYLFSQLIKIDPKNDKSFDYQYSLVNMQSATGREDLYEAELYKWVKEFGPNSGWAKSSKDKAKVNEALTKAELALRSHVLNLHKEAREQKNKAKMARAERGYKIYLDAFQQDVHTPEMQFYYAELLYEMNDYRRAYAEYLKVKPSKYDSQAKLNAVLTLEKLIPSDEETRRKVGKSTEKFQLTDDEEAFVKAGLAYLSDIKNREQRPEIKYRIASIYYSHNYFDESEKYFKEIISEYPGSKYSQYASDLILDSYKLKSDYAGLEKASKELISIGSKTGGVKTSKVKGILQQSAFKAIEEKAKTGEPSQIAQEFLGFVQEYPDSEYTDLAYYNAGINYEKAKMYKQALGAYSRVPKSNKEISQNAEEFSVLLYDKLGYLIQAADGYEKLAGLKNTSINDKKKYLTNASVIREAFNDVEGLSRVLGILKQYDSAVDVANYDYRFAKLYERIGNKSKASAHYLAFFNSNKGDKLSVVKSARAVADYYYESKNYSKANYWYNATKLAYDKYKNAGAAGAVADAAYSTLRLSDPLFYEYIKVEIPADPTKQQAAITKKLGYVDKINKKMTEVINYDDGYSIVSALHRLGQAYQHLTYAILSVPLPKGLTPEETNTFKKLLNDKVAPFRKDAINAYKKCLEKGDSLDTYNEDYLSAYYELSKIDSGYSNYQVPFVADGKLIQFDEKLLKSNQYISALSGKSENAALEVASNVLSTPNTLDESVYFALAHFYYEKGLPRVSQIFQDKVGDNYKKTADNLNLTALNNMLSGNRRAAIADFKEALLADASNVTAKANLGALFNVYGGYKSAYNLLKDVSDAGVIPNSVKHLVKNDYGVSLLGTNKINIAESEFKKALNLKSDYTPAAGNLAVLYTVIQKDKSLSNQYLSRYKKLANSQVDFDRIGILEKVQL